MAKVDKSKERRVLNIDHEDFVVIQKYCRDHDLKMHKWVGRLVVGIINNSKKTNLVS